MCLWVPTHVWCQVVGKWTPHLGSGVLRGGDQVLLNLEMEWLSRVFTLNGKRLPVYPHFPSRLGLLVLESKLLSYNKAVPHKDANEAVPFAHRQLSFCIQSACWDREPFLPYRCKLETCTLCASAQTAPRSPADLEHTWKVHLQPVTQVRRGHFHAPENLVFCAVSRAVTLSHNHAAIPQVNLLLKVNAWF
jgi:hypothetical protein